MFTSELRDRASAISQFSAASAVAPSGEHLVVGTRDVQAGMEVGEVYTGDEAPPAALPEFDMLFIGFVITCG